MKLSSMHQDTPLTGHLLFAHGSRDPLWRLPVEAVAARMCELAPSVKVSCAYLELCEPTLAQAAADLVAQGVRHIHVVPMFLGVGRHAREDLPVLMADLQKTYPELVLSLQMPIGQEPAMTELMAQLALQAPKL